MLDLRSCLRALRSLALAAATLLTFSSTVLAQTPTVMWNANTEPDLSGYVVQYGTQAGNPTSSVDVGNVTSRQFTGLSSPYEAPERPELRLRTDQKDLQACVAEILDLLLPAIRIKG